MAKGDPYPRGVAESVLLSIDALIATDDTGACPELLGVISLLSPDGVARDLLYLGESADIFGVGAAVDTAERSLTEALLSRRGWALWCLNQLADSPAQAVALGEPLVADLALTLGDADPQRPADQVDG